MPHKVEWISGSPAKEMYGFRKLELFVNMTHIIINSRRKHEPSTKVSETVLPMRMSSAGNLLTLKS